MKKRKKKHTLFDYKKLFDWWSVPHFMFGIVMALAAISFSWSAWYTLLGTLGVALLWEFLEKYVRLSEAPGNGWVDVLLPLLAFAITFILVDQAVLNHDRHLGLLTITLLLYGFINMIAWRARFEKDQDFLG
ncbi:MAG: hypothetical protein Q8O53_03185 [Candidatus Moranbacteria bacterium]|nr:hypothetical protein [Candidatus Moranbacteria bacterium]